MMALLDVEAAYRVARELHEQLTTDTNRRANREADPAGECPGGSTTSPNVAHRGRRPGRTST